MKKELIALASVLAIVAGCARENMGTAPKTHSGIKQITASIDGQTKAYLSEDGGIYKLFWYEEEGIKVGAGEQFADFTLVEGADTPKGKFESDEDLPTSDTWYAVSPAEALIGETDGAVSVNYPSELYYDESSCAASGGEIMVAKSSDTNFTFRNAVGYIKFQLSVKEAEKVSKIEIAGKDGKPIAGNASITFDGSSIDTVKFTSETESLLSVDFPNPVEVGTAEPFVAFIPVAPMANGFEITVSMVSGKSMTMKSSTGVHIGEMVELPVVEFAPVPVAKVEGVDYYSIRQAIQAADDLGKDVTIQITADCNVGNDCEILSTSIITLDLNGHTLYGVGDNYLTTGAGTKGVIIMDSSAEQTGTITNRNLGSSPIRIFGHTEMKSGKVVGGTAYGVYVQGGSFVMDGGKIEANSAGIYCKPATDNTIDSIVVQGDAFINTTSGSGVWVNSPKTDIIFRGGEILTKSVSVYVYDGFLKIYDGTFGSKTNIVYAHRSYDNQVDVYGGKFHRDSINAIIWGHTTTDSTRVYGGYYTAAVASSYIPAGYSIASCDTTIDGRHYIVTVTKNADVQATVSIAGGAPIEKATINEAFNAAVASGQDALITLVADCAPTDSMMVETDKKLTVDFNGKTLTCNSRKIFKIVGENSDITFKSSVEGGGIHQTSSSTGCFTFRQLAGKVTVESGVYEGTAGQYTCYATGGELHINGGDFITDSSVVWMSQGTLYVTGGNFKIRETSKRENKKCIYVTTNGTAVISGGSFPSMYVYDSNTKATITGGNYESFILGGGCRDVTIEDGTFQNIYFVPASAGNITVKGGTFNGRTYMDGAGTLNIEGGTFTNNDGYAMFPTSGTINIKNAEFTGNTTYGTLRFTGCSCTIEDGTVVNSVNEGGNALYVGSDSKKGTLTVNGGTFNSPKAIYGSNGVLQVNGGTFNSDGARLMYVAANCKADILGGYFNLGDREIGLFEGNGLAGVLKGGWFTKPVTAEAVNPSFVLDNSKSTTVGGVTYNYQVVENAAAPDVATVNGVGYKAVSQAFAAAADYSGADSEVTIKLVGPVEDTVFVNGTVDFTNASGKPVTFDFNNHMVRGTVDSLFVTTGVLTITDNSPERGGVLYSAKRRIISIDKEGIVNLKRIKIDNTRTGMGYSTALYSLITVTGTSSANKAELHISDGAKLITKNHYVKYVYVTYGTLTTENCEIITRYNSTSASASYPCIWAYSGAKVTVKSGTYLQSIAPTARGALYIATGNTSVGSSITVEDGAMIWSDGENGAIGSDKSNDVPYTSKTLHLNGGYLNKYNNAYLMYPAIYSDGKSIKEISPAFSYTNCLGETRTFGYQVK